MDITDTRPAAALNAEVNQQRGLRPPARRVPWTEERVEELKRLWGLGLTGTQIAAEFGDISRHAVIGKARRIYLPPRLNTRPGRPAKHRKPAPPIDDRMIPISQRKSFAELESWHCHYPVGEPGTPGFFFCGGPISEDLYCASHWARCHAR